MTTMNNILAMADQYDSIAWEIKSWYVGILTDIAFSDMLNDTDTDTDAFDDHYCYLANLATCKAADLRDMAARMAA